MAFASNVRAANMIASASTRGKSRASAAFRNRLPSPGKEKTLSMMTVPEIRNAHCMPLRANIGAAATGRACRIRILLGVSPFALAVVMKGATSISRIAASLKRASMAICGSASARVGSSRYRAWLSHDCSGLTPPVGNSCQCTANTSISAIATRKEGRAMNSCTNMARALLVADGFVIHTPMVVPSTDASKKLVSERVRDMGRRCAIRVFTGSPYSSLFPQSPCKNAYSQAMYLCGKGFSSSSATRMLAIVCWSPSVAKIVPVMSPGSQTKRAKSSIEKSHKNRAVGKRHKIANRNNERELSCMRYALLSFIESFTGRIEL